MKVWPIDPLVPRNLRLEVPEKLPQGSTEVARAGAVHHSSKLVGGPSAKPNQKVPGPLPEGV